MDNWMILYIFGFFVCFFITFLLLLYLVRKERQLLKNTQECEEMSRREYSVIKNIVFLFFISLLWPLTMSIYALMFASIVESYIFHKIKKNKAAL